MVQYIVTILFTIPGSTKCLRSQPISVFYKTDISPYMLIYHMQACSTSVNKVIDANL